jgi:hypothetical protein
MSKQSRGPAGMTRAELRNKNVKEANKRMKKFLELKRKLGDDPFDSLRMPADKRSEQQKRRDFLDSLLDEDPRMEDFSAKPRISTDKDKELLRAKGGLMEATAKLKAKGMKAGGEVKAEMTKKDKVVSIDKSPNSGLITQRGFGASRRT